MPPCLLEMIYIQAEEICVSAEDVFTGADLKGLPLTPSRPDMFLTGATLILATLIGSENDPDGLAILGSKSLHQ